MPDKPSFGPDGNVDYEFPEPELSPALKQALLVAQREPLLAQQGALLRSRIKRIVVLMLENRSFDHMLGWLGPSRGGPPPNATNPIVGFPDARLHRTALTDLPISPPHAGGATVAQIHEGAMDGFCQVFYDNRAAEMADHPTVDGHPARELPMFIQDGTGLYAFRHLAQHHRVCGRYFASVAAGTWPNRFFLYCGTANGQRGNGDVFDTDSAYFQNMPHRFLLDLIPSDNWRIYSHGVAWMRIFPEWRFRVLGDNSSDIDRFDRDCRRNRVPNFVLIDPNWTDAGKIRANDDLAPSDLRAGQDLIAFVYNSLLELPDNEWRRTLFVVTYDEHGGWFDHVSPPAPLGFDVKETDIAFSTLGVRVPTIVVSAWAPAGVDLVTTLDHASLYATVHRTLIPNANWLGPRPQVADTLAPLLTAASPRPKPPRIPKPARALETTPRRVPQPDDDDGGLRAWAAEMMRDRVG
jgi:phospholipase C